MNNIKLSHNIFGLPNADKGSWNEKWDEKEHGLARLVHPFKLLLSGRPNSGKTTVMHNMFLHIQTSNRPFKTLIIIQPSTSKEHDILDPTLILSDIPDAESLVNEDNGKTLLIVDDWDCDRLTKYQTQNLSKLFRYISSHHNISIMMSYQSFFNVPIIVRKTCNYFALWKTNNKDEVNLIAKRVGYDKKVFQKLFKDYIKDKHDFILVDQKSPHELRKNIFQVINYEDYDDN